MTLSSRADQANALATVYQLLWAHNFLTVTVESTAPEAPVQISADLPGPSEELGALLAALQALPAVGLVRVLPLLAIVA